MHQCSHLRDMNTLIERARDRSFLHVSRPIAGVEPRQTGREFSHGSLERLIEACIRLDQRQVVETEQSEDPPFRTVRGGS